MGGGGFALALGLRLGLGLGFALLPLGGGLFVATLEVAGAGFFLGGLGGSLGALVGVFFSPLLVLLPVLLLLLLLLLLSSPPPPVLQTPPTLAFAGPCPPHILTASHLPKPSSTERAKLGFVPNIRLNSVNPTRRDRPPPSRHSTHTPRGSPPHVCTLTT